MNNEEENNINFNKLNQSLDDLLETAQQAYAAELLTSIEMELFGESWLISKKCTFCKKNSLAHVDVTGKSIEDHPFFNNNLEYLEWESSKRSKVNYKEEGIRCGNCFHNNHYDFDNNAIGEKCRHAGGYYSDYQVCDCVHFVAFDNLMYLEFMLEQKENRV